MTWLGRLHALIARRRRADGESDVARDPQLARSRATGGLDSEAGDSAATTGTGANELFVGRVSGQDLGYTEPTGAEQRGRRGPTARPLSEPGSAPDVGGQRRRVPDRAARLRHWLRRVATGRRDRRDVTEMRQ